MLVVVKRRTVWEWGLPMSSWLGLCMPQPRRATKIALPFLAQIASCSRTPRAHPLAAPCVCLPTQPTLARHREKDVRMRVLLGPVLCQQLDARALSGIQVFILICRCLAGPPLLASPAPECLSCRPSSVCIGCLCPSKSHLSPPRELPASGATLFLSLSA